MKTVGIIAEYNPFHNGHAYQIQSIKEKTGATHVVIVMSGHFVQRGDIAIFDKWTRAKTALLCGADLVLELPACCSLQSAQGFAKNAVAMLHATNLVDILCFGSECGDIAVLSSAAGRLLRDDQELHAAIKTYHAQGFSYPRAHGAALEKFYADENMAALLKDPNNILGIEYIKALRVLQSPIKPETVKRFGAAHHAISISGEISSASAIRKALKEGNRAAFQKTVPDPAFLEMSGKRPVFMDALDPSIAAILRRMPADALKDLQDVSEGLEMRIKNAANEHSSFFEIAAHIKTKRYTHARICRILLHAILGIDRKTAGLSPQYLRVLGMTRNGAALLKQSKKIAALPYLTHPARQKDKLSAAAQRQLGYDILATDLYALASTQKTGCLDYKTPPVTLFES